LRTRALFSLRERNLFLDRRRGTSAAGGGRLRKARATGFRGPLRRLGPRGGSSRGGEHCRSLGRRSRARFGAAGFGGSLRASRSSCRLRLLGSRARRRIDLPPRRAYQFEAATGSPFFRGELVGSLRRRLGRTGLTSSSLLLSRSGPANADNVLRALTCFGFDGRLRLRALRLQLGPEPGTSRFHNARFTQFAAHQLGLLWRNGAAMAFERDPQLLTNLQHLAIVTSHFAGNLVKSDFIGHSSASLCSLLLVSFTTQVNTIQIARWD